MNRLFKNHYKLLSLNFIACFFLSFLLLFLTDFLKKDIVLAGEIKGENKQNNQKNNAKIGKFILKYESSNSNQEIRRILIESQVFDKVINNFNNSGLIIRENIPVIFRDCGDPNAYWNYKDKEIIICYENTAYDLFLFHEKAKYSLETAMVKSINETIFAFYHELGHALIDTLPLNVVGQEEDTVDEFASIMLYRNHDKNFAGEVVLDSSEYYELLYKENERSPSWDEHTPHDKRLFNLVCFVYGSNPEKYAEIFIEKFNLLDKEGIASEDNLKIRAARCQQEFTKKTESWNRLLLPHYTIKNNYQTPSSPINNSPGISEQGIYW